MSVINTNSKSIIAQNALSANNRAMSKTMEQLSTGKRLNGAADDAAAHGAGQPR
jgi:flagellin